MCAGAGVGGLSVCVCVGGLSVCVGVGGLSVCVGVGVGVGGLSLCVGVSGGHPINRIQINRIQNKHVIYI